MMLSLHQISLLYPVIVTAIWFVTFLFGKQSLWSPRFIMTLFMGSAFVTFLSGIGIYGGMLNLYKLIYPIPFFTALALFPLFYVYVLGIVRPTKIGKRLFLHFLPAGIIGFLAIIVFAIFMNGDEKNLYINEFLLKKTETLSGYHWKFYFMKSLDGIAKFLYILLSISYYIATFRLVNKHQKLIENYYSTLNEVSLNWVKTLFFFFILALISGIAVHFFHRRDIINSELLSSVPFLFLGTFFAIIGNYTNQQKAIIFPSEECVDESEMKNEELKDCKDEFCDTTVQIELKNKLEVYFEEQQPFLNPSLKIWDIVKDLNTNRTYVSRLINVEYGLSFSAFVNQYRIKEAKRLMSQSATSNYSLSSIAIMSGFINYSSFVRVFKKLEDETPSSFYQKVSSMNK